jgi:hypothetical protein
MNGIKKKSVNVAVVVSVKSLTKITTHSYTKYSDSSAKDADVSLWDVFSGIETD